MMDILTGSGGFFMAVDFIGKDMKDNFSDFKLPESQYIRQSQLIPFIVPFSSATLWRKVSEKTFPKPYKLSERITAWKTSDIRLWLESKSEGGE